MKPRLIDSNTIAETIEKYGITGAAKVLDCSYAGLLYQINKRGIPKPQRWDARARENKRQSVLKRYGYGGKQELISKLQLLEKEIGRCPTVRDLKNSSIELPCKSVFANRFGSFTQALAEAGLHKPVSKKKTKSIRKPRKAKPTRKPLLPLEERIYKSITPKLRFAILKRDKFRCQYCGRSPQEQGVVLHIDHIIPTSKKGITTYKNLITSCLECNLGKGNS